jgi:hypothetical protein
VFLVLQLVNSKQQQKLSLIENGNEATKPQIVKKSINGLPTPVHTEQHNSKLERGKAFRQICAAFVANIGPMNTGLIFGFSAVVIPQLQSSASSIQINEDQASWVGELKHCLSIFAFIMSSDTNATTCIASRTHFCTRGRKDIE